MSDGNLLDPNALTGQAAGVPFVAHPASRSSEEAATVVVWHMHDPPRSERAMAAALPLRGVDAWRVYLGLPLSGTRLPAGGLEAFFALGFEDAVLKVYGPTVQQQSTNFHKRWLSCDVDTGLPRGRSLSSVPRSGPSSLSPCSPQANCGSTR
jgi:hypothetical protein